MKKVELLSPAGSLEKLKFACLYGADAVYLGGNVFSLRAMSKNFTPEEMEEGIEFAHSLGKKAYIAVNIYPHNEDLENLPKYLKFLEEIKADAVLISDLGVFMTAKQVAPKLPIHISTQANVTNYAAALAWEKLGAERIVLARELSLKEITEIREKTKIPLEIFVHGAMCVSMSGRCLISSYLAERDSNRGNCAQPCRWNYELIEKNRPNENFSVTEDERGTYFFNSKDLCLLPHLKEVIESGAESLKIEGRMKSAGYVATVTRAYRQAIDAYYNDPENFSVKEKWLKEVEKVSHRPYWSGFFLGNGKTGGQIYSTSSYKQDAEFLGVVKSYDEQNKRAVAEQRGRLLNGETLEIMQPKGEVFSLKIAGLRDSEGKSIENTPHAKEIFSFSAEKAIEPYSIIRRIRDKQSKGF